MATLRSPAVRIYRRASERFDALRERLARHDFHPVVPPDALSEWECVDDRGTRVRCWGGTVLVEAVDEDRADEFDALHREAMPSDGVLPDGGASPLRVAAIAGSDEAGKGEPRRVLAVAAVVLPMDAEDDAIALGVRDSKLCSAGEIAAIARWLSRFEHEIRCIPASSRAHALREEGGNETRLLAALHAECLRALAARAPFGLARVDRFAPSRPVAARLPAMIVDECVRGERHPACAAASILARNAVLHPPSVHGTCQ